MKFALFFLALVGSGLCVPISPPRQIGSIEDSVRKYVVSQGYHARIYTVETEDGYQLDLVRLPHYRQNVTEAYMTRSLYSEDSQENYQKPAVLLMPGMMSTYEDFVVGGYSEGLAFALVDVGYDVYLGNVRGSFYGQNHSTLDPEKDKAFWMHSWHEIGVRDLPAIIDKVLTISGEDKLHYVGHMGGSTIFHVMASEKSEYNSKINKMISLGPVAFMKHANNEFLRRMDSEIVNKEVSILQNTQKKPSDVWTSGLMSRTFGMNSYSWDPEVLKEVDDKCQNEGYDQTICSDMYFIVNGYNSNNYNMTTVRAMTPRVPSPASSKQLLHYIQLMISGRFQKFDESFDRHVQNAEDYDLSKVTAETFILYAPDDSWSREEDVQHLVQELPNVTNVEKIEEVSNNIDLLLSKNLNDRLYPLIIQLLKQQRH